MLSTAWQSAICCDFVATLLRVLVHGILLQLYLICVRKWKSNVLRSINVVARVVTRFGFLFGHSFAQL